LFAGFALMLSGCVAALAAGSFVASDEMGKDIIGKGERRQGTIAALG
jgi:hypothetical protein